MEWLNRQSSLYRSHSDNQGRPATLRNILLAEFAVPHTYYDLDKGCNVGPVNDLSTIHTLRNLDRGSTDYQAQKKALKDTLQCYTPAALLASKKKAQVKEVERSGIMQLDFDYKDIWDYDVEELKRCVFDLPFIWFCGLSVSGDGFYALALIAEPDRLAEYAEHCFAVLESYGIKADTSKGKKPENLRYVSYDANMLIKENPEPLRIKRFKPQKKAPTPQMSQRLTVATNALQGGENRLIATGLERIAAAEVGNRWQTVQKWAYTLGGIGDPSILTQIKDTINTAPQFAGLEDKYIRCAEVCFKAGSEKLIQQ